MIDIRGSGGGGKGGGGSSRTPVEQPDSLHNTSYAVVLDALGGGEMYGPAKSNLLECIYLDGTPIANRDGSLNFSDVEVHWRPGTQDQQHIPGFPVASNMTMVGVEVKADQPWTQLITNSELDAVRVSIHTPQLMRMVTEGNNAGDRVGYKVNYEIDLSTNSGPFVPVVRSSLDGKTITGYTRTHRIELPAGSQWVVRVRRTTPEANDSAISDLIQVHSYAEVTDSKLRYPMTALVGIKINAEHFSSIPTRAYHLRGAIIRVPSNYDPISRTYTGIWDGTFKRAWSNNPAWAFYHLLTDKLLGLGEHVNASMIDRYALYQIGAWCDELVSDGQGGLEPRFTCNVSVMSKADALRVVNDFASVFRGMAYYANGQVVAVADRPSDPAYTFSNAKVVNGVFEYTGSDLSTVKTVALVSYNDMTDFGRSKVEAVHADNSLIARYGVRKTEVVAFGCNSRGQAQRVGNFQLLTSIMDSGGLTFSVGMEGFIPQPGDLIKIADNDLAGRQIGGIVKTATLNTLTLDRESPAKVGDTINVNVGGKMESRTVQGIIGRTVTVAPNFSAVPKTSAWTVDADDLVTRLVRVISVVENDDLTFTISGVFQHPDKHDAIDNGTKLDPLPVSVVPPRAQHAPTNIKIKQHSTVHQGTTRTRAEITWDAPEHAVVYDVQWRRDNGDWVQVPRTGTRLVEIPDIYTGTYIVRIRAINALDVPSLWAYSEATELDGLLGEPPVVSTLTTKGIVFGIEVKWTFPRTPNIIERTEIRYGKTNKFSDSILLGEYSYPTNNTTLMNLQNGAELWFWARLIDKNGLPGQWYPVGEGVFGKAESDPDIIRTYLEGQIAESWLAPGVIDGITAEVETEVTSGIFERITGLLTGDEESDELWYTGDLLDEDTAVGTITTISTINDGDQVQSVKIDAMGARIGDAEAAILSESQARASADQALAQQQTTMGARIGDAEAAILSESQARASADQALAQQQTTMGARIGDAEAAILSESQARASADQALAQQQTTMGARIGDAEAAIQQTSSAFTDMMGTARSQWNVKVEARSDGRQVISGIALGAGIEPNGTARSELLLRADMIALVNSLNGSLTAPFVFDTTGGFAYLNAALIKDGTITNAKVGDLQSTNYVTGQSGWRLPKSGAFEMNGSDGSGRMQISSNAIRIYNGSTLVAELGRLT